MDPTIRGEMDLTVLNFEQNTDNFDQNIDLDRYTVFHQHSVSYQTRLIWQNIVFGNTRLIWQNTVFENRR